MQPSQMNPPALRVLREPEGSCPAEKDNAGCFFLAEREALRLPEEISACKEFCDGSFRWLFSEHDAHGVSIEKTLPAIASEPKTRYPKKAADGAERGRNSMWAGARKLRRALRARLTHKKPDVRILRASGFLRIILKLPRVSGFPAQTLTRTLALRSSAEASRDSAAQAAAFCCFRRWYRCYRQFGRACTKRQRTDTCRRAEPEQCLREKLDFFSNVFKHSGPPLFFMVSR